MNLRVFLATLLCGSAQSWSTGSWRNKHVSQVPIYKNRVALLKVENDLKTKPPLVLSTEIRELEAELAEVAAGNRFLFMGGDCAETFREHSAQNIINNYKRSEDDKQMLDIIKETEQQVYDMYDTAVQQEKDWAKFLFKDGSMIGLNDILLNQYVEFMANKRMKAIGLKGPYDQPTNNNPLPWTTHWLNSRGLQNAPQETEIESYVVGGIKQDVEKETFKGFKL